MKTVWYRKETWSGQDREEFFMRLKRARPQSRPQYLRIQAYHLGESQPEIALDLLAKLVAEYPDARGEMAPAYLQMAECLARLGRSDEAIQYFRKTFAYEREFPYEITTAWIEFPKFVVKNRLVHLYPEALDLLVDPKDYLPLPIARFWLHTCRAIILAHMG